jgi:hypothetical protein
LVPKRLLILEKERVDQENRLLEEVLAKLEVRFKNKNDNENDINYEYRG